MSIFSILKKSLFQIDEYKNLIKISNIKFYLYVILLSVFFALYLFYNLSNLLFSFNKDIDKFIEDKVPNFTIENGNLNIEENIDYSFFDNSLKLIVNTTDNISFSNFPSYNDIILITKDKISIKSFNMVESISIAEVSAKLNIFSKQDLINNNLIKIVLNNLDYLLIFICFITAHIILLFKLIMLSLLVKVIEFYSKINLSFNEIFKFTAFAYTMPLLFLIILKIIGIYVPAVISVGIFYAISCLAIKDMEKESQNKEG